MDRLSETGNSIQYDIMKHILTIAAFTTLLSGCIQNTETPKMVADRYWQLLQAGEIVEAEKLVSKGSFQHFSHHVQRIDDIDKLENSESHTYVTTTITTVNPKTNYAHTQQFHTVLVQEEGDWKIDASQTSFPPPLTETEQKMEELSDDINRSVEENIQNFDEAMEQSMDILNEMLEEGSREMGESLQDMMNRLNESMKESVERLKKHREYQQEQEQQKLPPPDPESGEGMI